VQIELECLLTKTIENVLYLYMAQLDAHWKKRCLMTTTCTYAVLHSY